MKDGVEQARGQRDAEHVVAGGPDQVLAHDAQGGAGQVERGGDRGGLGAQQQNIAGFLGQVGAGAHGDAGVGLGEGAGVVDAVAHHGYAQAALLQGANARQLAGRIESGFDFADSGLAGDGLGGGLRVAGEHQHAQCPIGMFGLRSAQSGHSRGGVRAQCIAGVE